MDIRLQIEINIQSGQVVCNALICLTYCWYLNFALKGAAEFNRMDNDANDVDDVDDDNAYDMDDYTADSDDFSDGYEGSDLMAY